MIPATSENIADDYAVLANELVAFNPELVDKTKVLAVTKIDLIDDIELDRIKDCLPKNVPTVFISSVQQRGLNELKDLLWQTLNQPGMANE